MPIEPRTLLAMAVRAVAATSTDGVVFSPTCSDLYEAGWDNLNPAAQQHWIELSELLYYVLNPEARRLTLTIKTTKDSI